MSKRNFNPIIIEPDTNIGSNAAESDDEFLFECFVDHPNLAILRDINSPKMVAMGRTGSGKTAILRMIERLEANNSCIDLQDMSLEYVSNSDIIRFLTALDVDLDLFFQALWKHVLCIEYIRIRYNVKNEQNSRNLFDRITDYFRSDQRKTAALKYLKDWESKFWITMDENIKEITQRFESKIDTELAAEIEKFKGRAGYARTLSAEKKADITARARKIVNSGQLSDLNRILDLLSDYNEGNKYHRAYIFIDKLDERWVDDVIRFRLIRALIESLKTFRKIRTIKIVVAIRSDVIERVIQETKDLGFQREKYDDYLLRMNWNKKQLYELVQKRINFLCRKRYTSENIHFEDIFRSKISNKDPFDYLIERTLYRPRDIISFVNICLNKSVGEAEVRPLNIKAAEAEYSRIRLQSLIFEWGSTIPTLDVAFSMLSGKKDRFFISELATKEFIEDFIMKVTEDVKFGLGEICNLCRQYYETENIYLINDIARHLVSELYRIGAIGIKLRPEEKYYYSHFDDPVIMPSVIDVSTNKIHIHPMLHRALNVS